MTNDEAKQEIQRLVAKYEKLDSRAVKRYKEANTRDVFIRPLFEALGWDFSNFDEVEAEKTITAGRVDYLFKLNKVSKFCLEIKALHVDINEERWIRQAIGYAYNKGVTWAVLTNFKTLRVFNAERETKDINQIAFLNLTCGNYLADFHRLWLLSREAVANKDLDKEAEAYGRLPPRLPVEKRLYAQLRDWRETLFNEIYLYYKDDKEERLTWTEVDQLVQHLLNRLIFIRTAEDRGLIDRNLLAARHQWESSGGETDLMGSLRDIFHQFASLYDSDLFPLAMDRWDLVSVHNDRILSDIIQGLYEVPGGLADWDFATIGSDVLGTVYEQYLGYVPERIKKEVKEAQQRLFPAEPHIGLTAKKEKRKGEGIYYTPAWVVDYIVKQTVGRFLEERSYNDILNIKILDPACGSGSFLTRAYEELLNYHARQQGKSTAELDQSERTRILLRNIYGVDLDQQAVEIARLSLLLCSLSGQETLPSLANNIRQGNSLISGADDELRSYFGKHWRDRRPFNWEEEFPDIVKDGGFDVVIGNPPYITEQLDRAERSYFREAFAHSIVGKLNTYRLFIHLGINLLKEDGDLSFIVPNTLLTNRDSTKLRQRILENCQITSIITIPEKTHPFHMVTQATTVIILKKTKDSHSRRQTRVEYETNLVDPTALAAGKPSMSIAQGAFLSLPDFMFVLPERPELLELAKKIGGELNLACLAKVYQGEVNLTNYKPWILNEREDETYKPLLRGSDIDRYVVVRLGVKGKQTWVKSDKVTRQHAKADRIVTQEVSNMQQERRLKAGIAKQGCYCGHTTNYILPMEDLKVNPLLILGLLNSKLLDFYFKLFNTTNHLPARELERLPIPRIDLDNHKEKKMHDDLVKLVDKMLDLNKSLATTPITHVDKRDELMREIERTDDRIDNLVYDLYRLTDEERQIVEEQTKRGGS